MLTYTVKGLSDGVSFLNGDVQERYENHLCSFYSEIPEQK